MSNQKINYPDKNSDINAADELRKFSAEDANQIKATVNSHADSIDLNTADIETVNTKVDNLVFEGVQTVDTVADLPSDPIPAESTTAKVANNTADPTKNGNWYVSGGVWVQYSYAVLSDLDSTSSNIPIDSVAVYGELNRIKLKNYPFANDAVSLDPTISTAIKDIKLYNIDPSKNYTVGVFKKNVSGTYTIQIHEYDAGFSTRFTFNETSYTPSSDVEVLKIDGVIDGTFAIVTVDWSSVADGVSRTGQAYVRAGINQFSYKGSEFLNPDARNFAEMQYPFSVNATSLDQELKDSILDIELYGANPDQDYTMSVLRKNTGGDCQIIIYEINGTTFGALACSFSVDPYTPSSNIERLELIGSIGVKGYITIDWSKLAEGYTSGGMKTARAGISYSTYKTNSVADADGSVNNFGLILPDNLYISPSVEYWLYDRSILENEQALVNGRNTILVESHANITRENNITKIDGSASFDFDITVRKNDYLTPSNKVLENVFTKNTNVFSKTKNSSGSLDVLCITDSYFDFDWGDGIYEYMKSFSLADGVTLNFKGTRTSYGNLGESYGSWTANKFYNNYVPLATREPVNGDSTSVNMSSPFVFSSDDTVENASFDFGQYLSANSIGNLDKIVLFLGMNGGDGTWLTPMIDNIKLALPTVEIFVCMVPPTDLVRINADSDITQLGRDYRNVSYLQTYDNRESENIYLVPTTAVFNRQYHTISAETPILQFEDTYAPKQLISNNIHPNAGGARSLAYIIYNYINLIF